MQSNDWRAACLLGAVIAAIAVAPPGRAQPAPSPADAALPTALVGDLHALFGDHHARAVHAKGIVLEGSFEPAAPARDLSSAAVFRAALPVIVRFSDFTGLPDIPDTSPDASPRGMAVRIGTGAAALDLVTHSFNGFPVATAAEFGVFLRAIAASGPGTAPPTPLDRYMADHAAAKAFLTTQIPPPVSYATVAYYSVNAVTFVAADGRRQAVRTRFVPQAGEHALDAAARAAMGPDYLREEIARRVAAGPVRFDWVAQLAGPGDRIDDPSVAWPEGRPLVPLGTITVDRLAADQAASDKGLLFLPARLPAGIDAADPMLAIRNAAYSVSFGARQ